MEKNEGFRVTVPMLLQGLRALVFGDLMMRCLYRTRPYEKVPGSADALRDKWQKICMEHFAAKKPKTSYKQICRGIVADFDALPIDETLKKPRVGIVGEILVKYMPLANNHLVDLLEREGAEAVVPDFLDFIAMFVYDRDYKHKYLGREWMETLVAKVGVPAMDLLRKPAADAL
jgi:predicted nucleotide-binding protein (sugar kinase/HSP70/actin superfamily)